MRPVKPCPFPMTVSVVILFQLLASTTPAVAQGPSPSAGPPVDAVTVSAPPPGSSAVPAARALGCDIARAAWVGTADQGLACLDDAGWHTITGEGSGLLGDDVRDLAIGPDGRVWVVQLQGLSVTDGKAWETLPASDWGSTVAEALAVGPDGSLWLAHLGGVSRFDGTDWTTWPLAELGIVAEGEYAQAIAVSLEGTAWLATTSSLASFDGTAWTAYTLGDGLSEQYYFEDIAAGPAGVFAAHSDGVLGWDGSAWLSNGGDDLTYAQALAFAPDGSVWAGTWMRGASVFEDVGWRSYDRAGSGISSDDVTSLSVDDDGRVWAGTAYGLDVLADGAWANYHMHDSGLLDDVVTAVAVGGSGPVLPPTSEKAPGSLGGVLLEGGAPLAGTTVELCTETTTWASEGSTPCADLPFSMQATTGADGHFSFEAVPVGRYDVLVNASSGDWVSAVMALGALSERFAVQEGAATDIGSVDIAPAG
jgi:ligand-binding sensor domain-containing protein